MSKCTRCEALDSRELDYKDKMKELEELLKESAERFAGVLEYEWCENKLEDLIDKIEKITGGKS